MRDENEGREIHFWKLVLGLTQKSETGREGGKSTALIDRLRLHMKRLRTVMGVQGMSIREECGSLLHLDDTLARKHRTRAQQTWQHLPPCADAAEAG